MNFFNIFKRYEKKEVINAYLFLIPLILTVTLFVFVPVIGTFINSLMRDIAFEEGPAKFIGFKNYIELLTTDDFKNALIFTLKFAFVTVLLEAIFGMIFALILNETFKGRGILRTVILIPWAVPTIVSAKTWKFIYDYQYGLLNWFVVGDNINWFADANTAFWAIVIADVWKTTPFIVIILLSGLQAIPSDLYKQARIDGTGMFKSFWKITLPLVRPVLTISLIFRTVDALRIFDLVYALTGGGPSGSTQTLSTIGYKYFSFNFGMGSTISIVTFLVAFGISIIYIKLGKFGDSIK